MAWVRLDNLFAEAYGGLPKDLQKATDKALLKLQENPPRPSLNLERIKGTEVYWTIRVNLKYRILLRLEMEQEKEVFVAVDVGPHDSYRRWS